MSKTILYKAIDVSYHNGNINFAKVKESGIDAVIIRGGYGFNTVDKNFHTNMVGAIASGLHIGVYWFGYAIKTGQAKKEAEFLTKLLKEYSGKIDLPIFYDWEYDSYNYAVKNGVKPTAELISNLNIEFCDYMEKQGYFSGVYANVDYCNRFLNDNVRNRYTIWIAQWDKQCTYTGPYGIWQYGGETNLIDSKNVSGINGVVDKNYIYVDYPKIIKDSSLNGYSKIITGEVEYNYDVNNDGIVNTADLLSLKNHLLTKKD